MDTKRISLFLLAVTLFFVTGNAKSLKEDPSVWRYDIECAGAGVQGSYLIKVWVYAKNAKVASDLLKRAAVHGVIFKGFSGKDGCTSQKPLAASPTVMEEKADFFNKFFADKGDFLKYASTVSNTPEVVKIGKNDYKVGMTLSVSKDLLRKDLEDAGIVKSLSSGF